MKFSALLATAVCLSLGQGTQAGKSNEDRLVADLLAGLAPVGKIARPVPAAGGNVTVAISLSLVRLASPSDKVFELDLWIYLFWNDSRLAWDPKNYGGIKSMALPYDAVWLPDIRPFDAISYKPDKEMASQVMVSSEGEVKYVLPASIATRCKMTKTFTCIVKFGSWSYQSNDMDLMLQKDPAPFDLRIVKPDGVWEPVRTEGERSAVQFDCCPYPFVTIDFKMEVKRTNKLKDTGAEALIPKDKVSTKLEKPVNLTAEATN